MNSEIFDKAQSIISGRRLRAVEENERRIREINDKIPQIREINAELFNTGKELIGLIGDKNSNAADKIEKLRKYNLEAQKMSRTILVENGYPADYLDMHYTCEKCRDTGYCGSEFCDCLNQLCGKLSADELNKHAQLSLSSFDTFDLRYYNGQDRETMQRIFSFTKDYAENFKRDSKSILMFGRTGLGKTHLSLAIANTVLSKGYSVIYDSAVNILRKIESERFSRDSISETIDSVMNTDLLILDDLGTEYETPFFNATIYNIINTRLNSGKPAIISTNLDFEGIRRRYDDRVVSRIVAVYSCLEFKGEDIRLQIRKNENT